MRTVEAIKAVQAHRSTDMTLPILCALHVTEDGYVEATDRYTVARAKLEEGHGLTPGLYSPSAVKILLAGGVTEPDVDGDFPAIEHLFVTPSDVEYKAGPVRFNPKFLARFAPAKIPTSKSGGLVLTPGETPKKPWLVTVNGVDRDEWQALIVPIRLEV